jgi:hypothetical protein
MVLVVFIEVRSILHTPNVALELSSVTRKRAPKSVRKLACLSLTLLSLRMVLFVIGSTLLR